MTARTAGDLVREVAEVNIASNPVAEVTRWVDLYCLHLHKALALASVERRVGQSAAMEQLPFRWLRWALRHSPA
jgi:hypothetical protein